MPKTNRKRKSSGQSASGTASTRTYLGAPPEVLDTRKLLTECPLLTWAQAESLVLDGLYPEHAHYGFWFSNDPQINELDRRIAEYIELNKRQ